MLDLITRDAETAETRGRTNHTIFESCVATGPFEGETEVEGTIPSWLRGRLMRTAPGLLELGSYRAAHWFDGLGMVYRLDIEPSGVRFGQRLLETKALAAARAGRMDLSTFAGRNERSFFKRLVQPIPRMTDNTNVNIVPTPDGWLAMTETPTQYLVEGDSLRIKRRAHYDDTLGKLASMLAHPEWDAAAGQLVNVALRIGPKAELVAYRHALGESVRRPIGKIVLDEIPYLHAFALTPKKVVIVAPPMHAKPLSMLWSNKGYAEFFRWHAELPTRVFVIDRRTGEVSRHEADTFFFFHSVNAFDDGDGVVMDLCAYRDPSFFETGRMDKIGDGPTVDSHLERLTISAGRTRVTRERLDAGTLEFPSVHRAAVAGRRHRVVFGATVESGTRAVVRRIDLESGRTASFSRDDVVYGEPVFVARPDAAGEGDGVLLVMGSDLSRGAAELVVLDAGTLDPLATARLPIPIPLGFHGSFQRASS